MLGTFVLHGFGIRRGVDLNKVTNLDVAPTIADLLGRKLTEADGQVLTDALAE